MKAKFGAIVVSGSGKLGGHVFSRNRAGAYMRTKVTPVNPDTTYQAEARNRLTTWSQEWRTLTGNQRNAWQAAVGDFAKTDVFGDLKNPSGFNLYQRLNNNLQIVGGAALTLPPLPAEVYAAATLSVAADVSDQSIDVTYTAAIPAGQAVKVFATPGMSPGINFVKSEFRLLEVIVTADASPYDIGPAWVARFGSFVLGEKIFVKLVGVNSTTGQEGVGLTSSAIAVA